MTVSKAVVSFYRTSEERAIERYKARLKVQEEHQTLSTFKKNVTDFLGLNEQATRLGLRSFDLKLYRLAKISGKIENYSLSTQQQLDGTEGNSRCGHSLMSRQKKVPEAS